MPLYSVAGSQGTGKSTLLDALQLPSIQRKTSRSILSDWGVTLSEVNNNRDLTIRFQDEILARKISDEAFAVMSNEVLFTERTYADLFVYALVAIGKDNEYSDWLDSYFERCKAAQDSYAKVFYLTGGHFQPVNDGVRAINKHYSQMVDMLMLPYTNRMNNHSGLVIIDTPDLNKRVSIIQQAINGEQ